MAVTIRRHCVPSLPDRGLSPLQQALLDSTCPVRIASAPTGAGKTYAFARAVTSLNSEGARVLFIVPTKRLAQNIVLGLISDLVNEHDWPKKLAERKVALWTGDATKGFYASGGREITVNRINQLYGLDDAPGGEMIVAVPEVLSYLLIGRFMKAGQAADGIFTVLNQFDHIVFDEFHTISARGFGLAAFCARLAAGNNGQRYGRARVSFLSATPLSIRHVLEGIGINKESIVELREDITEEGRPVHGNVQLVLGHYNDMAAMVETCLATIRSELNNQGQITLIFDSLGNLKRELPAIKRHLQHAGISPGQTLLINSIDDSTAEHENNGHDRDFFVRGRERNPLDFRILIATSSVEMGVTFRSRLLFMEPGFEPMNFLQRYGRCARGDKNGRVCVRIDDTSLSRRPWLRSFQRWIKENDGHFVSINELTKILAQSTISRFEDSEHESSHHVFGSLTSRATYTSGLYWNVAMAHPSNKGPRRDHLRQCQPVTARIIASLLRKVAEMEDDLFSGSAVAKWIKQFKAQAQILRNIGCRIRVVDKYGRSQSVDVQLLRQQTDLLDRYPMFIADDGEEELHIRERLEDGFRDSPEFCQRYCTVCFPYTEQVYTFKDDGFLLEQWCRHLRNDSLAEDAWENFPDAMGAAEKLTRYTGLVIEDKDEALSMETVSGVL